MATLITSCDQGEKFKEVSLSKKDVSSLEEKNAKSDQTLKFGFDLRLGAKEDVRIYLPFLRYLEGKIGQKITVRFTPDYEDTAKNLGTGKIHFAAIGPVNAVIAHEKYKSGYLAMGLNVMDKAEYRSVIFTRVDSDIYDLSQLRGNPFAFGDNFSTQGYVLPRKMLEDAGISLSQLSNYTFSGSHDETVRLVMSGNFVAGGLQDTLGAKLAAEKKIRILARSGPSPSSLICYNRDVDPEIVRQVKQALLDFDPIGKDAKYLYHWDRTEMPHGFVSPDEEALEKIKQLITTYGLLKR